MNSSVDVKNTNMTEYDLEILKFGKQTVDEARKKLELPDAGAPPNKIVEYLMFYRTVSFFFLANYFIIFS